MSTRERSYIMIKPDGVQRGLIGDIVGRFEKRGFKLIAMKFVVPSLAQAQKHYDDLKARPFFGGLCEFLSSGPVVAMVWEGDNVVAVGRQMIGATKPSESAPGTIRGDLAVDVGRNVIHGSDSVATAKTEIALWFTDAELAQWNVTNGPWVYEKA
eukprot:TRINITY_DN1555_c0_g1_i1.p2 TRINITY_DN1555_c0_g1~~TRINITY_DN1555_c0_g1_i1.p2  ORF type:complete len:170 (-),score=28.75 TRINITY_DN1555_c0_g1_i1:1143-1607(-)